VTKRRRAKVKADAANQFRRRRKKFTALYQVNSRGDFVSVRIRQINGFLTIGLP
jgi:hypothetical protein